MHSPIPPANTLFPVSPRHIFPTSYTITLPFSIPLTIDYISFCLLLSPSLPSHHPFRPMLPYACCLSISLVPFLYLSPPLSVTIVSPPMPSGVLSIPCTSHNDFLSLISTPPPPLSAFIFCFPYTPLPFLLHRSTLSIPPFICKVHPPSVLPLPSSPSLPPPPLYLQLTCLFPFCPPTTLVQC